MNLVRQLKGWIYSQYPSSSAKLHEKRRKGLFYLNVSPEILVCQKAQDRIFWEKFLRPQVGGLFWEVGAGDGVVGSHTLGLDLTSRHMLQEADRSVGSQHKFDPGSAFFEATPVNRILPSGERESNA